MPWTRKTKANENKIKLDRMRAFRGMSQSTIFCTLVPHTHQQIITMGKIVSGLLAIVIIPAMVFGQATKKIKDKETGEYYFVLKSDNSVKQGDYQKYSYNNKLLIQGYYNQGARDSLWECYDLDGKSTLKYDFRKNEVLFYDTARKANCGRTYKVLHAENGADTILSRPPVFLQGSGLINAVLMKNLHYPDEARENGTSGRVHILFTVDKNGKTSNYHVNTPLGFGTDEEALRVLKMLPDDWLPGLVGKLPVDVEVDCPVVFQLE